MRSPELPAGTGLALAVLLVLVVVAVLGERGGEDGGGEPVPPSAAALSVYDGRSPSEPGGREQRVLVELPRPALADRDDLESLSADEQRAYVRSLEREGTALRSALGARGVELRDAVSFGRTWDGFAATVDNSDLASLPSLGVRALPVRRFYPATSEPIPVPGAPKQPASPPGSQDPIAILDTGAEAPGYDAARPRRRPEPGRRRAHALAARDAPAPPWPSSSRRRGSGCSRSASPATAPIAPEIHGTTDTLLAGLERAVDPDGDGAVDDAVRVALVGVNAPYAAFADSAEAQAVRGAGRLGTLVVAPAGNEGPARPPNGVVGSPGRRPHGARGGSDGGRRGRPARRGHDRRARAARRGGPRRSAAPGQRAARRPGHGHGHRGAAARPRRARRADRARPRRAQPGRPGVRGRRRRSPRRPARRPPRPPAADAARGPRGRPRDRPDRSRREGRPGRGEGRPRAVRQGHPRPPEGGDPSRPAPFSSRGPAFDGTPKPDALAEGAAVTAVGLVSGTAVAAARVAVRAARLARERPAETPAGLREALVPPEAAEARGAPPAPAVPLGPLELTRSGDEVVGVRFTLGAFDRGDPLAGGARIEPAARLDLELSTRGGAVQQRLTPPDGARDLLPAEYAYRLPAGALKDLDAGEYRFRATARAPRRERPRTRRSPAFEVR